MLLDKMIQALIDFAKERFSTKSTSRERAARAFERLYKALTDCHRAYVSWRTQGEKGEGSAEYQTWTESIVALLDAFRRVRTQLSIFDPESVPVFGGFMVGETGLHHRASQTMIRGEAPSTDQHQDAEHPGPLLLSCKARAEFRASADSPIGDELREMGQRQTSAENVTEAMEEETSYNKAEEMLRRFIKREFRVEDLF